MLLSLASCLQKPQELGREDILIQNHQGPHLAMTGEPRGFSRVGPCPWGPRDSGLWFGKLAGEVFLCYTNTRNGDRPEVSPLPALPFLSASSSAQLRNPLVCLGWPWWPRLLSAGHWFASVAFSVRPDRPPGSVSGVLPGCWWLAM